MVLSAGIANRRAMAIWRWKLKSIWALLALGALIAGCASSAPKDEGTAEATGRSGNRASGEEPPAKAVFASIQPILQQKCVGCHGGEKPAEGIDLRTHESVMKGGEHGATVKAGDAKASALVMVLRGEGGMKKMPLNQPPLSDEEIAAIEKWVNDGANP